MIDGFKTSSLALDVHQLANKLGVYINIEGLIFGFTDRVDVTTGEIRKLCNLHGSLHKYANGGLHNADSFRLSDLCRVLTELKEVYGINSDITRLYSVEFGVNLKLPYDPQRILKAIRMYKGYTFTPIGKIGRRLYPIVVVSSFNFTGSHSPSWLYSTTNDLTRCPRGIYSCNIIRLIFSV